MFSDKVQIYQILISTFPNVELNGAKMSYTSFNGHMYSFLVNDGSLGPKLPTKERNEFVIEHRKKLCTPRHNSKRVCFGSRKLFLNTEMIKEYFIISFDYVSSLSPKPTKKRKYFNQ